MKSHRIENNNEKTTKNKWIIAISLTLAIILIATTLLLIFINKKTGVLNDMFVIQKLNLNTEDEYALKTYDYEHLDEVQTTLRADTMYVTKRGLQRPIPELVSDTYTVSSSNPNYSNTIEFTKYPSPTSGINENMFADAAYEMAQNLGLPLNSEASLAEARTKYFWYYKYMLLSQGHALAATYQNMSKLGTLTQSNLKKHPAADSQYGAVEGTNNAVEKVIVLDPTYRALHPTGLYLPAGEIVTVKVEGLAKNEKLSMVVARNSNLGWRGNAGTELAKNEIKEAGGEFKNDYFTDTDFITASNRFYNCFEYKINEKTGEEYLENTLISAQWKRQNNRMPWINGTFEFVENGTYYIGLPFGGIMHINMNNSYSQSKLTITGAVETPHYILGVTTPEYFNEYLRDAPGVIGVIETENGQLIGESKYLRDTKTDEIDKLAMLWHSFFSVNESFTGGTYNRNNLVLFDQHVPAGAAVALGGMVYACPSGWYDRATDYRGLLQGGQWGILHEVGHSHGNSYGTVWGFSGNQEGEVRNNALIALSYLKFCDIGTTRDSNGNISAEHGFVAHPYSNLKFTLNINKNLNDFNNYEYFQALSMYVNIMHSFGVDKFYELLYTYKTNSNTVPAGSIGNKRSDFAYRCSLVYGMDFRNYFNSLYKANITENMFNTEQLDFMNKLPVYEPIANLYAGGIDGIKTGGDYRITYGPDVVMDLKGKTICANSNFSITEIKQPRHGKIINNGDGTVNYKFNENYTGNEDQFKFTVKQENGQKHEFTVFLRISYNRTKISHYNSVKAKNINLAIDEIKNQTPTISFGNVSGIADYKNSDNKTSEVKVSEFYYKADRNGEHSFSLIGDDQVKLYFGTDKQNIEEKLTVTSYNGNYKLAPHFEIELQKDKIYYFKLINFNAGGLGNAFVGLKNENTGKISNLNMQNIYHADFTLSQINKIKPYVFEPSFLVSKKDNVLNGSLSNSKSDWKILEAPENIANGRYVEEEVKDPQNPDEVLGVITTDKWTWLIDGQTNTIFHTAWRGNNIKPPTPLNPDVFVIDTNMQQQFNYFNINTRNSADAYITNYELLISSDNKTYKTISKGENLTYKNYVAKLNFPTVSGRYWKLIVNGTSGKNFTIISELSAGVVATAQRVMPITSSNLFTTKNWQNSKTIAEMPSGMMITKHKNEKMVIRFIGEEISLYASVAPNYGSAKVLIDGNYAGTINLKHNQALNKKLVFAQQNLKSGVHTIEVITNSSEVFNLNYIGIPFSASLVNAPNIYLEKALIISLIVFICLFLVVITLLLLAWLVPSVRKFLFGNKLVKKWDSHRELLKVQKKIEKQKLKEYNEMFDDNNAQIVKRELDKKSMSVAQESPNKNTMSEIKQSKNKKDRK